MIAVWPCLSYLAHNNDAQYDQEECGGMEAFKHVILIIDAP